MSDQGNDSPAGKGRKPCPSTSEPNEFQTPSPGMEAKRRPPSSASAIQPLSASASSNQPLSSQTESDEDDDDMPIVTSRRQLLLSNPLFQHQAVEDRDGLSVVGSDNSIDDRDLPNLSCVTDGSYSDGEKDIYIASLGSQADQLGFGTPLHEQGRERFRSTFDPSFARLAGASWQGMVCPAGHKCLNRQFIREAAHTCDKCAVVISAGTSGGRCKFCDYDICENCFTSGPVIPDVQHLQVQTYVPEQPVVSLLAHLDISTVADVAKPTIELFSIFAPRVVEEVTVPPLLLPVSSRPSGRLSLKKPVKQSVASIQTDDSTPPLAVEYVTVSTQTETTPPLTLEDVKALGLLTLEDMRKEFWALLRSSQ